MISEEQIKLPIVLILSSKESLPVAKAIQNNIADHCSALIWTQNIFKLSHFYLESLEEQLTAIDYAVAVLAPDDISFMRGNTAQVPRDNVVFELGLFIGKLGRKRVFAVMPANVKDLHILSDLLGWEVGTYDTRHATLDAALVPFCNKIMSHIKRRDSREPLLHFGVESDADQERFYQTLASSIANAETENLRSGRGFSPSAKADCKYMAMLIDSYRTALERGVRFTRIQTSDSVHAHWADAFASIMNEYSNALDVYCDYINPPLVNVSVVDADRERCVVQLMFESDMYSKEEAASPCTSAIWIRGNRSLARDIKTQFLKRISVLQRLNSQDYRELGKSFVYFAYGANLDLHRLKTHCPSAEVVENGVLYGWRPSLSVMAVHRTGSVMGIFEDSTKNVHGVLYRLTYDDKKNLDRHEGGYTAIDVYVDTAKSGRVKAFTYRPRPERNIVSAYVEPDHEYIGFMLNGAKAHGLTEVVNWLGSVGHKA